MCVCEHRKMPRKTHKMLMEIIMAGNGIMSIGRLGKCLLCFYGCSKVSPSDRYYFCNLKIKSDEKIKM